MIEMIGVTKKYGDRTVIDSLSLTINKGTKTAVMGASGKGKTTLLRIIAGLEKIDAGEIKLHGSVAYMFQEPRLLPWKNALDNIKTVLKKEQYGIAQKYLDAVGLSDSVRKYPQELSGGMAQRVAFARFLAFAEASDADILLLDEPFSALDEETGEQMTELLIDNAKDRTLLFVTHDALQAEKVSDSIVNIK